MATKKKLPPRELPTRPAGLVDQFVKGPMTAEAVQDLSMAFKKALIGRALGAERRDIIWAIHRARVRRKPPTNATADAARPC